ncbi:MAG TPA: AAA family ATPase [Caldisericia bacterium]|jgi:hypothetical protein|nr:AAA family ATPase [Caldisericia bacterium]
MKKLPIGIQSFKSIREENYYYVDKTPFVKELSESGKYYFLSRPRRFGKSLFLDTLKEAFLGSRELFKGLYLYDNWDWSKKHPVIKISFGKGVHITSQDLNTKILEEFMDIENNFNIKLEKPSNSGKLEEAIKKLSEKYGERVVVLVDEYDKPILDRIEEIAIAKENREILKDFYSVLKDADPYLKLVFITGVSRFSKVSIFSGLNQLNDITIDERFSTICGYTQDDLEEVFSDRLQDVDKDEVKRWYNGYSWLGGKVYNPFDILLFLDKKTYSSYWFETGTPTFLMKLILQNRFYLPKLESLKASEEIVSNLDIDFIKIENILFQTGYLTIKEKKRLTEKTFYELTYPNIEVKMSFNNFYLNDTLPSISDKEESQINIIEALQNNDISRLREILYSFFSSIPGEWYRKNEIDRYEGYYASVIYALLNGSGLHTITEDATSVGRIDITVIYRGRVYILEFKVVDKDKEGGALKQIKERRYYEKYQGMYGDIYILGIEFSKEKRNIVNFEWEKLA